MGDFPPNTLLAKMVFASQRVRGRGGLHGWRIAALWIARSRRANSSVVIEGWTKGSGGTDILFAWHLPTFLKFPRNPKSLG